MLALSKATLRRVRRRDKAARWVVTLGGMAVIASVIAIVVLIVGTVLPLFQPARIRLIAEQPLPASMARRGRRWPSASRWAWMRRSCWSPTPRPRRDGYVSRSAHRGHLAADRGDRDGRADDSGRGADWDGRARTIRAVEQTGAGEYSLVWSDGTVSLVEVGVQAVRRGGPHDPPVCTVRTRATIPPENGLLPVRAIVRSAKDTEGVVTCAAAAGRPHPGGPPGPRRKPARRGDDEDRADDPPARDPGDHRPHRPGRRGREPLRRHLRRRPALVAAGRRRPGRRSRK